MMSTKLRELNNSLSFQFERCVEYDEYKTNNTNYQYTIRLRGV